MIWNKARECMSRDELAVLQGKRLVELVRYVYDKVEYYRKKMWSIGLEPDDIRGIEDLEKLPFTTREDLIEAYPLGKIAVSGSRIASYQFSNHGDGHAGMETAAGYTQMDMDIWKECMARSISMAGLGEQDVIQVAYSDGLCTEGLGAQYGAEAVGAAVVLSPDCRPAALVARMRRLGVTGMISTPVHLKCLAQMVEERGLRNSLHLKAAICGGESWTEGIREKIQRRLGIRLYGIFGLNELTRLGVACECECQKGMHIQEDFFLAEILDTHMKLVLPGGRGELVFTTLQKKGVPLIRYRTGGITGIYYERCECGRTMARMDRLSHGIDDVVQVRGGSVPVSRIEEALSGLQGIDASYIICIGMEHNVDVVDVCIINMKGEGALPAADVKRLAAGAVAAVIGVEPEVHIAERGKTETFDGILGITDEVFQEALEGRKVTIVDRRRY